MRVQDLRLLFDYNYAANERILAAAARVTAEQFVAPTAITPRNLRATLAHALDVEWSWRARVQGVPEEVWSAEIQEDDIPTVDALTERWRADERETRAYLDTLTDTDLDQLLGPEGGKAIPLWCVLLHVINHGTQSRSDAAVLLTSYGSSPGDLDLLDVLTFPSR